MSYRHSTLPAFGVSCAPFAYGEPQSRAQFKVKPDDFLVEEFLGFEPAGEGEHLFMQVRTDEHNTRYTQKQLARSLSLPARAVSYSGLKDRRGLTTQWFSAHLPGKNKEPDCAQLRDQGIEILRHLRHNKKLKIGTHKFNRFCIHLRQVQQPQDMLTRLPLIQKQGVPNYFGAQRFGWNGGNVEEALEWVKRCALPGDRSQRSRVLSTLRSWLFNGHLSQRVQSESWQAWQPDDPIVLAGSNSFFYEAEWHAALQQRYLDGDIHLGGWLPGMDSNDIVDNESVENSAASPECISFLALAKMKKSVRPLRLLPRNLVYRLDGDSVWIEFLLPVGAYATSVLREWVVLDQVRSVD